MNAHRSAVRRFRAYVVAAVCLGVAAAALPARTGLALVFGLGPDFEPIGAEVGEGGLPVRVRHVPSGIVLVLVPSGAFAMGSPSTEPDRDSDEEQRSGRVEAPLYMGETEVTIEQWRTVGGPIPPENEFSDDPSLPVGGVSWYMAREFVRRLNALGEPGWRLPSEMEWEFACRAGTTTIFSFGNSISPAQANFDGLRPYDGAVRGLKRGRPVPVRSFPPNAWGFYDMHGNVWEWCYDEYVPHPDVTTSRDSEVGDSRVLRGGAYTSRGSQLRSAYRDGYAPASTGANYGLRVVKTVLR